MSLGCDSKTPKSDRSRMIFQFVIIPIEGRVYNTPDSTKENGQLYFLRNSQNRKLRIIPIKQSGNLNLTSGIITLNSFYVLA